MNKSYSELERDAYMSGNVELAKVYAHIEDLIEHEDDDRLEKENMRDENNHLRDIIDRAIAELEQA